MRLHAVGRNSHDNFTFFFYFFFIPGTWTSWENSFLLCSTSVKELITRVNLTFSTSSAIQLPIVQLQWLIKATFTVSVHISECVLEKKRKTGRGTEVLYIPSPEILRESILSSPNDWIKNDFWLIYNNKWQKRSDNQNNVSLSILPFRVWMLECRLAFAAFQCLIIEKIKKRVVI